eukprot:g1780.t1
MKPAKTPARPGLTAILTLMCGSLVCLAVSIACLYHFWWRHEDHLLNHAGPGEESVYHLYDDAGTGHARRVRMTASSPRATAYRVTFKGVKVEARTSAEIGNMDVVDHEAQTARHKTQKRTASETDPKSEERTPSGSDHANGEEGEGDNSLKPLLDDEGLLSDDDDDEEPRPRPGPQSALGNSLPDYNKTRQRKKRRISVDRQRRPALHHPEGSFHHRWPLRELVLPSPDNQWVTTSPQPGRGKKEKRKVLPLPLPAHYPEDYRNGFGLEVQVGAARVLLPLHTAADFSRLGDDESGLLDECVGDDPFQLGWPRVREPPRGTLAAAVEFPGAQTSLVHLVDADPKAPLGRLPGAERIKPAPLVQNSSILLPSWVTDGRCISAADGAGSEELLSEVPNGAGKGDGDGPLGGRRKKRRGGDQRTFLKDLQEQKLVGGKGNAAGSPSASLPGVTDCWISAAFRDKRASLVWHVPQSHLAFMDFLRQDVRARREMRRKEVVSAYTRQSAGDGEQAEAGGAAAAESIKNGGCSSIVSPNGGLKWPADAKAAAKTANGGTGSCHEREKEGVAVNEHMKPVFSFRVTGPRGEWVKDPQLIIGAAPRESAVARFPLAKGLHLSELPFDVVARAVRHPEMQTALREAAANDEVLAKSVALQEALLGKEGRLPENKDVITVWSHMLADAHFESRFLQTIVQSVSAASFEEASPEQVARCRGPQIGSEQQQQAVGSEPEDAEGDRDAGSSAAPAPPPAILQLKDLHENFEFEAKLWDLRTGKIRIRGKGVRERDATLVHAAEDRYRRAGTLRATWVSAEWVEDQEEVGGGGGGGGSCNGGLVGLPATDPGRSRRPSSRGHPTTNGVRQPRAKTNGEQHNLFEYVEGTSPTSKLVFSEFKELGYLIRFLPHYPLIDLAAPLYDLVDAAIKESGGDCENGPEVAFRLKSPSPTPVDDPKGSEEQGQGSPSPRNGSRGQGQHPLFETKRAGDGAGDGIKRIWYTLRPADYCYCRNVTTDGGGSRESSKSSSGRRRAGGAPNHAGGSPRLNGGGANLGGSSKGGNGREFSLPHCFRRGTSDNRLAMVLGLPFHRAYYVGYDFESKQILLPDMSSSHA